MSTHKKWVLGILAVMGVLLVNVLLGDGGNEGQEQAATQTPQRSQSVSQPSGSQDPYTGEVSDGRSFGEVIAAMEAGGPSGDRFNRIIDDIDPKCPGGREWVSDRIVRGYQMMEEDNVDVAPIDVAVGWQEALQGSQGTNLDCVEVLSTLLASLERRY